MSLPGDAVIADVERLVRNLIAMNEILRDHERVSVRLVMTPDRLVIDEARRTFTYLNLYGYLTDAVDRQPRLPRRGRARTSAPGASASRSGWPTSRPPSRRCRCCARPTSRRRSSAPRCSTASATRSSPTPTRRPSCTRRLTQELEVGADVARLRIDLPFADKGDISLKKIGLELVVRVDGHKRTLMLPPALGDYRPAGAAFEDGSLQVTFDGPARG